MAVLLPRANERLIDVGRDGIPRPTPVYYRFWQGLADLAAAAGVTPAQFQSLLIYLGSTDGTLEGLPPYEPGGGLPPNTNVQGQMSVESAGSLSQGGVLINLLNDVETPAPTTYYGADGTGAKGWFPIADAFAAGVGIELTVDAAGVTTVALAALADAGGGVLQKFQRDAYGRVAGTSAATTDDLTEGAANLYFTTERAQDATGAAIAAGTGDGVTLAYDDSANAISATNTDKGSVAVAAHEAAPDPHPQYTTAPEALYLVSLRF